MKHYARQSPRGFVNEINVHSFGSKAERDAWVEAHRDDGGVNSASEGARACTAKEAKRILAQQGDNQLVEE